MSFTTDKGSSSRELKEPALTLTSISSLLREFSVPALYVILIVGLIIFIVSRDLPKAGHDYGFFLPRLLDTHLHHRVNGLSVQWYTANFGAGTPAYANPQYVQYSMTQFLLFIVNPWTALMLSLVTYSVIGFASFYFFLKEEMGWISDASALGASFILVNGFFIEHAIVGHVGFQHFPLLGAILLLAFTKRLGFLLSGLLMGLLSAMIVNQAGFVILIIFAFSLLITLPLIYLLRADLFKSKLFLALLTGAVSAALLSISKISAVLAFMRSFPRFIEDDYGQTYFQGINGMVRQLTGFNFIVPYQLLTGGNMEEVASFFQEGAGTQFGIWEMDIAISPALLFLLLFGIGYSIVGMSKTRSTISRDKMIAALLLILAIWLMTDMTLAQGWLYSLIKPLPVIRSIHANVRFTSALIFPLALLGTFIFHKAFKDKKTGGQAMFLLLGISTIALIGMYLVVPEDVHVRNFNITSTLSTYADMDKGSNFTVTRVEEITDMEVFQRGSSNLATQDPIFGYVGEFFTPKVTIGPILEVRDGYYNLTNPAGYVFPQENNLRPFDLFREDQKADLELFINHKQPNFEISSWQNFADGLNLLALVLALFYLLVEITKGSVKAWQARSLQKYSHEERVI